MTVSGNVIGEERHYTKGSSTKDDKLRQPQTRDKIIQVLIWRKSQRDLMEEEIVESQKEGGGEGRRY